MNNIPVGVYTIAICENLSMTIEVPGQYTVVIPGHAPPTNPVFSVENCNDVNLTWDPPGGDCSPEGYIVYVDGEIADTVSGMQISLPDLSPGVYSLGVSAYYLNCGETEKVYSGAVVIDEGFPPYNFFIIPLWGDDDLAFSWEYFPIPGEDWIHWDDETTAGADGIGLTSGGTFYVASHWLSSDLAGYTGQYITKIRFYTGNFPGSTFVLKVWKGANAGTLVLSQNVASVIPDSWNEITLNAPVLIENSELWFGYQLTHTASQYPAGVDAGPAVANKGDMISLDGIIWESMSVNYGLDYNWSLQAFVSPVDNGIAHAEPLGYNIDPVYNDGKLEVIPNQKSNCMQEEKDIIAFNIYHALYGDPFYLLATVPINGGGFIHEDVCDLGFVHSYAVTCVYTNCESVYSNIDIFVCEGTSEFTINNLKIYPNPADDYLVVESKKGIHHIIITDVMGKKVFDKEYNHEKQVRIGSSNYINGLYNIQVWTEDGPVISKFIVR